MNIQVATIYTYSYHSPIKCTVARSYHVALRRTQGVYLIVRNYKHWAVEMNPITMTDGTDRLVPCGL